MALGIPPTPYRGRGLVRVKIAYPDPYPAVPYPKPTGVQKPLIIPRTWSCGRNRGWNHRKWFWHYKFIYPPMWVVVGFRTIFGFLHLSLLTFYVFGPTSCSRRGSESDVVACVFEPKPSANFRHFLASSCSSSFRFIGVVDVAAI